MAHRLAPQARAELVDIWSYIARESGNAAAADGVIDAITERFYLLARYPRMGRARDDLRYRGEVGGVSSPETIPRGRLP
jgi:plasmid stabilization system protein ParE